MTPRIAPVTSIDVGLLRTAEAAAGGPIRHEANVYRTLAVSPKLMSAWLAWGGQVVRRTALSPVLRELVVLRVALLAEGHYPLVQHVRIAREVGVDEALLARVLEDPTSAGWDGVTGAALSAVDQLHHHGRFDDQRWNDVLAQLGVTATFDLVATVAFFRMACWMLNVCGTPLDDGQADVELGSPEPFLGFDAELAQQVRVATLSLDEWTTELLDDTATWPRFHGRLELRRAGVYCTLAHHPALFRAVGPVMAHLLVDNALTDPQREIVIMRSCLHDRGAYPYRQHARIAGDAGVDPSTLDQLGAERPLIEQPVDRALVAAVDELHRDNSVSDSTWALLADHLESGAIMDAIVTAGFYGFISLLLNTAGTVLEPGETTLPSRPFDKAREANP